MTRTLSAPNAPSTSTSGTEKNTPTTTGKPVVSVHNLHKSFGPKEVLSGIDLQIARGEIVALIGRSGSGKSTILKVLAGLSDSHSGEVDVVGDPSVAFQEPRLFPWRTVVDNVAFGLNREKIPFDHARGRASALLREVHLPDSDGAWPLTLSGGQAQRVSLARALISDPDLLLLDEPKEHNNEELTALPHQARCPQRNCRAHLRSSGVLYLRCDSGGYLRGRPVAGDPPGG